MSTAVPIPGNKNTPCVDFDGVIHSYTSGWQGAAVIPDPPVPGAMRWLLEASKHFNVVIYSSRSKEPAAIVVMKRWFKHNAGAYDELSASEVNALMDAITFAEPKDGKPAAFLTIDDRAICFDGDWGKLDPATLREFKPWYQQTKIITETIADDLAVAQDSVTK